MREAIDLRIQRLETVHSAACQAAYVFPRLSVAAMRSDDVETMNVLCGQHQWLSSLRGKSELDHFSEFCSEALRTIRLPPVVQTLFDNIMRDSEPHYEVGFVECELWNVATGIQELHVALTNSLELEKRMQGDSQSSRIRRRIVGRLEFEKQYPSVSKASGALFAELRSALWRYALSEPHIAVDDFWMSSGNQKRLHDRQWAVCFIDPDSRLSERPREALAEYDRLCRWMDDTNEFGEVGCNTSVTKWTSHLLESAGRKFDAPVGFELLGSDGNVFYATALAIEALLSAEPKLRRPLLCPKAIDAGRTAKEAEPVAYYTRKQAIAFLKAEGVPQSSAYKMVEKIIDTERGEVLVSVFDCKTPGLLDEWRKRRDKRLLNAEERQQRESRNSHGLRNVKTPKIS